MTMKSALSILNPQQQEAVKTIQGPILVMAGPGAGKTRVLTRRIAYIIQKGVRPENILAVTFTNKAAEEMKKRVSKLIGNNSVFQKRLIKCLPTIGTFHSVCVQILRREIDKLGYRKNFIIYDSKDQLSLMKQIIKDLLMNPEQFKPATLSENISRAKDELVDAQTYQKRADEYWPKKIAEIYLKYQAALKKANALDFDDLIMLTVRLFQKEPAVLEKYQNKWQYILVDEAHDTNFSQYRLINLLAQKHKNLCLIADPDQSIYSWRGADFRNILNFEKDYPEAKVILLEQNYRSTQNILEASHHVIVKNKERKEKKLWTENTVGPLIQIAEVANEQKEGDFIVSEIKNLLNQHSHSLNLKDFTVLYRTNAQSRAIEEAFLKANFPYKIIGAVRFYERTEIKDILAYLKLLINPNDSVSLQRVINVPPRRLAKYKLEQLHWSSSSKELLQWSCSNAANAALRFQALIQSLYQASQTLPLSKLINLIVQKTDYENYIKNKNEDGEKRWENIQELLTVANKYNKIKPPLGLSRFLEEVSLLNHADEIKTEKDLVNLMTLHCAKGLEFPVVFMAGLEESIFPHSKSLFDPAQIEEERRLCYVGMTRAKQKLYLTFAQKRRIYGSLMVNPPSRFLLDIPEHLIEFYAGT